MPRTVRYKETTTAFPLGKRLNTERIQNEYRTAPACSAEEQKLKYELPNHAVLRG